MSEPALLTEQNDHVLTVTINRPEKKNAVNAEVLCGLSDAWHRLDAEHELRVCILTGRGENFCAGMDLSVINKLTSGQPPDDEFEERLKSEPNIIMDGWLKTYRPTKPVIAAVEGFALAGGTEILQGTDIRVAGESAVFGVTEVRRALFPLAGSTVRLPRQIPYTIALEMLLTGADYTARQCLEFGLVGHVVPDGQTLAKAREIANVIAGNGPMAVRAILKSVRESFGLPEKQAFDEKEMPCGLPVFSSEDAREGPKAFLEKRKPVFQDR
ncbi:MAG: crotonase/enoyl-CoA hydratase family protein [bacterium]|nr:crotonase/enoyl-CoA hydratase family protein [bacterium]MCP5040210.1 crotonase/enoyl-CoA hydratase family protein [bacterium]